MPSELALSRRTFTRYAVVSGVILVGIALTLIVSADYSDWTGVLVCSALLAVGLFVFGTLGYRMQYRGPGRVQINTMLGSHQVDLRKGYRLKLGRVVHVMRVGRKRYRLNAAIADSSQVEQWLASCAERQDNLR